MKERDLLDLARSVAAAALKEGVDAAEAYASRSWEREVKVREGVVDRTIETGALGCGLRVDLNDRQGFASTSDLSEHGLEELVRTARAVAGEAEPSEHGAIPEVPPAKEQALDLWDEALEDLDFTECTRIATEAEEAALAVSEEVSPGEGSTFSHGRGEIAVASTRGAERRSRGTHCGVASFPVAGSGERRQRQYWYEARRFLNELPSALEVGRKAGERALRMLDARPVPPGRAAIVFDPLEGARFWAGLSSAFHGDSVRRGVTFLAADLGKEIASPCVTLIDDPLIPRALGSRPFDGEGWPTSRHRLIEEGRMSTLLYDSRTARLAGKASTGNASRSYAGVPSPSALAPRLAPGRQTPAQILKEAGAGLYVTQLIGFGMNLVTGEYSRGASGWWFEGGELAHPVHEVTISGNLREILKGIAVVGNDLVHRSSASSPTFLVESMIVSGSGR